MSNETKFTAGTWRLTDQDWSESKFITCDKRKGMDDIAEVPHAFDSQIHFEREQLANAHLIATAPDLYGALKELLDTEGIIVSFHNREIVKKLLAKARGETNETN